MKDRIITITLRDTTKLGDCNLEIIGEEKADVNIGYSQANIFRELLTLLIGEPVKMGKGYTIRVTNTKEDSET